MSKIVISKGKILKDDVVNITYTETRSSVSKPAHIAYEGEDTPHPDLKNAFLKLVIHAALLGEFISASKVSDIEKVDPELISDFKVSGFSLSGTELDQVIITGQKTLKSGKVMGFNTPVTRFADDSDNAYQFMEELQSAIDECCDRLIDYLNGKYGNPIQPELGFEKEEVINKVQVLPDLTKVPDLDPEPQIPSFNDDEKVTKSSRKRKPQTPANPSGE